MTALRGLGASRTPLDDVGGVVQRKPKSAPGCHPFYDERIGMAARHATAATGPGAHQDGRISLDGVDCRDCVTPPFGSPTTRANTAIRRAWTISWGVLSEARDSQVELLRRMLLGT